MTTSVSNKKKQERENQNGDKEKKSQVLLGPQNILARTSEREHYGPNWGKSNQKIRQGRRERGKEQALIRKA